MAPPSNRDAAPPSISAMRTRSLAALSTCSLIAAVGCFRVRGADGGGQDVAQKTARAPSGEQVHLPAGYRIAAVAKNLTFPVGIAFDDAGELHVVESGYSYGEKFTAPRLLHLGKDGAVRVVATGTGGPWTGVVFAKGAFFVADGNVKEGGRILRIDKNGTIKPIVEGLPSYGDHHTNGPALGPDGMLYFSQGTATNAGVVGEDNHEFGWLERKRDFRDVPCQDVTLAGVNFESKNPLGPDENAKVSTGAYVPFGTKTEKGQVIKGAVPCTGAVMKVSPDGGKPELVAWGFRNPFGLAFSGDGRLFLTENGYDVRGSRPVWGTADHLYEVKPGVWYGWPDFSGGMPVTAKRFAVPGKDPPAFVFDKHPNTPPPPIAFFGVHSSSNGFAFSKSPAFGHVGQAFVSQFGDMAPKVGKTLDPVGFKVVRVDTTNGVITDFAVNAGDQNGPASKIGHEGLERPTDCKFDPTGAALYVADFGVMTVSEKGPSPVEKTGVLWRIVRTGEGDQ